METCTACGQEKEAEAFGFRNRTAGRRHRVCKTCVAEYGRKHYAVNRSVYVSRNNRRARAHTRTLKTHVWDYLLQHPCVDCGLPDALLLDFDHVDPSKKRKTIHKLVHQAYSWAAVLAEINQCEVRCANCHRRRTAAQFAWPKLTFNVANVAAQASASLPTHEPRPRRKGPPRTCVVAKETPTQAMIAAGFRVCCWCGIAKHPEQFHLRDKATGRRNSICGVCFTAYRREHYRMNRKNYIRRNTLILRLRGRIWSRRLWEYLLTHPCVDCGESDPLVLECDHVDRVTKRQSVGFLARSGYPWATVLAELAKCEVRCANCHRRRTAVQFGWPKLSVSTLTGMA